MDKKQRLLERKSCPQAIPPSQALLSNGFFGDFCHRNQQQTARFQEIHTLHASPCFKSFKNPKRWASTLARFREKTAIPGSLSPKSPENPSDFVTSVLYGSRFLAGFPFAAVRHNNQGAARLPGRTATGNTQVFWRNIRESRRYGKHVGPILLDDWKQHCRIYPRTKTTCPAISRASDVPRGTAVTGAAASPHGGTFRWKPRAPAPKSCCHAAG